MKGPTSFTLQMCQFRDRFDYAYASVWEGNFTNCVFSTGECTRPLEGDDCVVVTCDGGKILCPPACESLDTGQYAWLQCGTGCKILCVSDCVAPRKLRFALHSPL